MQFWQRFAITVAAMLLTGFLAGLIWQRIFGIPLPSYLGGMIGGFTAVPVWEFLKRIKPKEYTGKP